MNDPYMPQKFSIVDMVLMDSPEWPYLNQIGEVIEYYLNGDSKLTYVVRTSVTDVGVSPDLCIDARPILREQKLKEIGI